MFAVFQLPGVLGTLFHGLQYQASKSSLEEALLLASLLLLVYSLVVCWSPLANLYLFFFFYLATFWSWSHPYHHLSLTHFILSHRTAFSHNLYQSSICVCQTSTHIAVNCLQLSRYWHYRLLASLSAHAWIKFIMPTIRQGTWWKFICLAPKHHFSKEREYAFSSSFLPAGK